VNIGLALRARRWIEKKGQYRTGQEKVTKGLHFTYLGRSPHWCDPYQKLCSRWRPRRAKFSGVTIYRKSNFLFSYWFL